MDYRKEFRVDPDSKVKLSKLDPAYKNKHESQEEAKQEIDGYLRKLFQQQALLYAEHKHLILVVPAGARRRRERRHDQACFHRP
jgi:hypothetical protein